MKAKTIGLYSIRRNRELIFMETLKDLENRLYFQQKSPYNLVRKSALLRLLVIDGEKFYNTINREYKIKLETPIKSYTRSSHGLATFEPASSSFITAEYRIEKEGELFSIPKYLALPIVMINNPHIKEYLDNDHIKETYSVSGIIKLVANAHGGVHFKKWGEEVSSYIATDADSPFNINQNSVLHEVIDNTINVILNMLNPLREAVHENLKKTKPIVYESSVTVEVINKDNQRSNGSIGKSDKGSQ